MHHGFLRHCLSERGKYRKPNYTCPSHPVVMAVRGIFLDELSHLGVSGGVRCREKMRRTWHEWLGILPYQLPLLHKLKSSMKGQEKSNGEKIQIITSVEGTYDVVDVNSRVNIKGGSDVRWGNEDVIPPMICAPQVSCSTNSVSTMLHAPMQWRREGRDVINAALKIQSPDSDAITAN